MRETRQSGSEGGAGFHSSFLPLSLPPVLDEPTRAFSCAAPPTDSGSASRRSVDPLSVCRNTMPFRVHEILRVADPRSAAVRVRMRSLGSVS
jgi:hypothetical protein